MTVSPPSCARLLRPTAGIRRGGVLRPWLVTLLLLMGVLSACRPSPTDVPGATPYRIVEVTFSGVQAVDVRDLEAVLATRRDRYNPFEARRTWNRFALQQDLQRIVTFYQTRGYFDARVTDWEVTFDEDRERARVRFEIDEGAPTYLVNVQFNTRQLRQIDPRTLTGGLPLRRGTIFNVNDAEAARQEMRRRMQESSYAYARVDMRVYVDRAARTAELFYFFEPGPASLFGEIQVRGNRRIPDDTIRSRVRIRQGNVYRQSLLRVAQLELYDMNVFSLVTVESTAEDREFEAMEHVGERPAWAWADRSDLFRREVLDAHRSQVSPGHELAFEWVDSAFAGGGLIAQADGGGPLFDPNVPIRITVMELPSANYRIGGGLGIESGRTESFARANAVWRNVLSPLNRVEADGRLGHAWLPNLLQADTRGIVGSAQLGYSRPGAFFRLADFSTRLRYEEDIEPGYRYASPRARLGLSRRLTRDLTLSVGYNVDLFFIRDDDLRGAASDSILPREFALAYFDTMLQYDRRDNPLSARRGYYGEMLVEVGETFLLGQYHFLKLQPEFRHFQPMGRRLVLASRARAGTIFSFGDERVIRTQRFFVGGADSVRGFRRRQISPYEFALPDGSLSDDPACLVVDRSDDRCRRVPVGGFSLLVLNVEPRYVIGRDWLVGAVFVDAGYVGDDELSWRFQPGADGLHVGTGAGLRLITPIGPIRTDLAWRLTDAPEYAGLGRFGFYLSIGEAF